VNIIEQPLEPVSSFTSDPTLNDLNQGNFIDTSDRSFIDPNDDNSFLDQSDDDFDTSNDDDGFI